MLRYHSSLLTKAVMLLSMALVVLSGCKEDEPTRSELLTSGTWNFSVSEVSGTGSDQLIKGLYDAVYNNSKLIFSPDGTGSLAVLTISNDVQWSLSDDETKINFTTSGDTSVWTILELTANTLRVSLTESGGTVTMTFTK